MSDEIIIEVEGTPATVATGGFDDWKVIDGIAAAFFDEAHPPVKVKLTRAGARVPQYQTAGAAGCDLHAAIEAPRWVHVNERWVIDTGVCIELPDGYEAQVRGRSGLFRDHGILVASGTIDSDYRGAIGINLINLGSKAYEVKPGDRIAQLVIAPVARARFEVVGALSDSERGEGGFGSTGR